METVAANWNEALRPPEVTGNRELAAFVTRTCVRFVNWLLTQAGNRFQRITGRQAPQNDIEINFSKALLQVFLQNHLI